MSTLQNADATPLAVNGPLLEHPRADISCRNDAKSPFLRLPLEIRLEIYELAVKENREICPRQVTKGSNLFVWGDANYERHHPGLQELSWAQKGGSQLTVTALLATCKAIYAELRERPVFYRVNTFKFTRPSGIHPYLAALTPARRNAIREIVCDMWPSFWFSQKLPTSHFDDVLPILTHCRDLRLFRLVQKPVRYGEALRIHSAEWNEYLDTYRQMILRAEEDDGHDATIWSLPSLTVDFAFSDPHSGPPAQELTDLKTRLEQVLARRHRAANRTNLKALYTPEHMQSAVHRAEVDLVGEVRLTRDRGEADGAPIATRTRGQKEAKQTANKYGTLKSPVGPKYDFNGHLQWDFVGIKKVRWSPHTIECEVAYFVGDCNPQGQAWPSSFEPIHVLGTEYALERLRVFYQSFYLSPELTLAAAKQLIEQMQSMPSPKDCAQELPEMMTLKSRRSVWKSMQNVWVKTFGHLQSYVRHLERQNRVTLRGGAEEVQPAGPGDKREAESTIHCAAPRRKKART